MSTSPSDQPDLPEVVRYVVPVEFKARFDGWLRERGWEAVLWPGEDVPTYVIRPQDRPLNPPGVAGPTAGLLMGRVRPPVTDQGTEPSSVGHAAVQRWHPAALCTRRCTPAHPDPTCPVHGSPSAAEVYQQASEVDPWPGEIVEAEIVEEADSRPLPEDVRMHALGRPYDHGDGRLCAYHHRLGLWTFDGLHECLREHPRTFLP